MTSSEQCRVFSLYVVRHSHWWERYVHFIQKCTSTHIKKKSFNRKNTLACVYSEKKQQDVVVLLSFLSTIDYLVVVVAVHCIRRNNYVLYSYYTWCPVWGNTQHVFRSLGGFLSLTVCRFSLLMLYTNLDLFCNRCITNKCSGSSDYFKIMCVFV